ncbi:sulfate permease 2 [Microdochium trichocladiopsis]|uniref:Sulfate permease 2 n=1 Tax=Microdochium trichocladiopsis TaxID=1682393 RepID=A0A9P9BST4_9PEZI|nr:sulfate permease 2 [Microdochium trichocladiopsis]KAH7035175.1 sulfate permease 2 [Microdochium trichocladiopsis]
MSRRREIGHALAKALGIQLEEPEYDNPVTRGESVFSNHTADGFVEQQPSSAEWLDELIPTARDVAEYLKSLFPFLSWIGFYNLQWLLGDLVAGITVGAVVIPQGMAYARLAALPVEFGLYSSFMGVLCYWFFATSKDITIGPVAVMSTLVGSIVTRAIEADPEAYRDQPWIVACALSVICGCIVLFIGLIRCGWIVELMPLVSLASFMTGSAISIASGQVSTMLGITGVNTREATYLVIINTLKRLPTTTLDASVGLTALFLLYCIRFACTYYAKKFPQRAKLFFFLSTLRTAFIILLYTLISWLVNRERSTSAFKLLGPVPTGFQHAAVPKINKDIISLFVNDLPAAVIVLLIEHIAISKSFGRVNNYTINPSQEMVAIGVTNILGPFLGGYPATGSFSRTAIKSKAGVRTPFAGVITAAVVLIAIYCLGAMFYWIPQAALAGVIIHAVGDLITPPQTLYKFWRVSPLEVFIFFVGVIVIVFSSIENGIYVTMVLSFCVYMYRVLRSKGDFLGKVKVHSVLGDHVIGNDNNVVGSYGTMKPQSDSADPGSMATRNLFLPIGNADGSNPELEISSPYPGVFIYRFQESFNYPSATSTLTFLSNYIFANTRRTATNTYTRPGDRPWNDPGPKKGHAEDTSLPTLKAIILDFSSVSNVDVTSVQHLIDVRNQMDRYTQPDYVDWHMACINSRWTKRALVSAGFGYPTERADGKHVEWRSIFSIAEIGGDSSAAAAAAREYEHGEKDAVGQSTEQSAHGTQNDLGPDGIQTKTNNNHVAAGKASSVEEDEGIAATGFSQVQPSGSMGAASSSSGVSNNHAAAKRRVVVHGLNRPLFHTDLTSALQSAIANVEARAEVETRGGSDIGITP